MKLKSMNENYEKKDYEMKAHLLGNLPNGYEDVKTQISGKESEFSVRDIEREIAKKWNRDFATTQLSGAGNMAFNIEDHQGNPRAAICQVLVEVLSYRHTYIYIIGMVHRYSYTLTNYTCRDEYCIVTVASSVDAARHGSPQ